MCDLVGTELHPLTCAIIGANDAVSMVIRFYNHETLTHKYDMY